jgi:hypothetical protein
MRRRQAWEHGWLTIALAIALLGSVAGAIAAPARAEVIEGADSTPVLIAKDGSCCAAQPASPYPSTIEIAADGLPTEVEVALWGLRETDAEGLEVLLVGPTGGRIVLMASYEPGRHIALDDSAWTFRTLTHRVQCPDPEGTFNPSGATEPFDCGLPAPFPTPAPEGPYAERLEDLGDGGSSGAWSLYVANDANDGEGDIAGGWSLRLHVTPAVPVNQPASSDGPEAQEHAGLGAAEELAEFQARKREEEQARQAQEASERERGKQTATSPPCVAPALRGHTLHGAKVLLARGHCRLGRVTVHGRARREIVVIEQGVPRGRHLANGAAIAIALGVRP